MKIGLFDSGIGGLNVLNELLKKYPNNTYYYYGDTKNIPYGNKDKQTLLDLSTAIIRFFEKKSVDLIIIACGTISSNCYLELKKITSIPIIDIISPTIEYLNSISKEDILVLGTNKTIESHLFKNQLQKKVYELATPLLVPMIENLEIDTNVIKNYLLNYQFVSVLVLGCTHYPILINEFKKYLKSDVLVVDMGVCLVNKLKISNDGKSEINLFFSQIDDNLIKNIKMIIPHEYHINKA